MLDKLFKQAIFFFSGWIKRDKKKWVFASHTNFGDNARYFFEDAYNPNNIRKIWIAKNKDEFNLVKSFGYECYLKGSCQAKYHALTAKNYIYTCYVSDIGYQYSRGANCINLWHGLPLKKIEFDIHSGPLAKKFNGTIKSRIKHPEIYRRHDYVLCPSEYVYKYAFKTAFRLNDNQILEFAYPRSIFLKHMQKKMEKFEFLYVPTWRDHLPNFITNDVLNLEEINRFCINNDCIFKIKLHPNTKINLDLSAYAYIKIVNPKDDPNMHLVNADCLITDYYSIFFDYLVFDKLILFYVFDESDYKSKSRDMYPEAEKINCGKKINIQKDLLLAMQGVLEGYDDYAMQRSKVIQDFGLDIKDQDNRKLYNKLTMI